MNKIRLLFVTPYYKPAHVYGGPSYSVPALCEALVNLGAEVTVFSTNANGQRNLPGSPGTLHDIDGVQVYYYKRDLPGNYFYSTQLRSACYNQIRSSAFDLVYVASNWGYPFLPSSRSARSRSIPYVVTPRTSFMESTWKGKYFKKKIYHDLVERSLINGASALHYTTSFEVQESAWLDLNPQAFVVPNPVQFAEFELLPERKIFRRRYGILESDKVLLYLGRVEQRKGIDISLSAFAQIADNFPDSKFVIAGPEEDNYKKTLVEMVSKLNIIDRVIFTGYLNPSQRLEALVDANLFILTSHSENFGMSVVDALAVGLPVIISDRVGLADIVQQENLGLVTPLEVEKVSLALITLLQNATLCKEIGCRARKIVREKYTPEVVADKMLIEFDRILSKRKPS